MLPKTVPRVSIVVLNWNGRKDTVECLDSLVHIDYPNYEVLVVDNGSTDDSVTAIKSRFGNAIILQNGENRGYAGGNNVGIAYALKHSADYVYILNNDTVVSPDVISALVDASLRYPEAGVFGSRTYYYHDPDKIWYGGLHDHVYEDVYIFGAALFFKAEVAENIGVFEEKFFLVHEETDWCYRARRAGYHCLVVPESKVWHKVSASFGSNSLFAYFFVRNKLLLSERNPNELPMAMAWREVLYALVPHFSLHGDAREFFLKRVYWGFASFLSALRLRITDPYYKCQVIGVRDYLLRRFGNAPDSVWRLRGVRE